MEASYENPGNESLKAEHSRGERCSNYSTILAKTSRESKTCSELSANQISNLVGWVYQ